MIRINCPACGCGTEIDPIDSHDIMVAICEHCDNRFIYGFILVASNLLSEETLRFSVNATNQFVIGLTHELKDTEV